MVELYSPTIATPATPSDGMIPSSPSLPNTLSESLRRWARMAGWPSALSAGMSVFTLLGLSLLYRQLPINEAGTLALLLSTSEILSLVSLIGLVTVVTRLYASAGPGVYDWVTDLARTAAYSLPILFLGSIAFVLVYDLPTPMGIYFLGLTTVTSLLAAVFSMLNAEGYYAWSAFLIRIPNASLVLPGLAGLLAISRVRLDGVLAVLLVATLLALALGTYLLRRFLSRGTLRLTRRQRFEGLAFTAMAFADLLPEQGLISVAGRILPVSQVAAFAAVAVLAQPFRLLRGVLGMILAPDLVRYRRPSYRKLLAGVWGLGLACGIAIAILGPPIASRLYDGRYQDAVAWIPYLAMAGVLLLGGMTPRIDLSVRAPFQYVNRFAAGYLASVVFALILSLAGMRASGAAFLPAAVVLLQATACAVSYAFWWRFRHRETAGQPPNSKP